MMMIAARSRPGPMSENAAVSPLAMTSITVAGAITVEIMTHTSYSMNSQLTDLLLPEILVALDTSNHRLAMASPHSYLNSCLAASCHQHQVSSL